MFATDYRRIARENLKDNWKLSIGVAAVAVLLGGIMHGSLFLPSKELEADTLAELLVLLQAFLPFILLGTAVAIIQIIIGGTVQLGHAQYLLDQHDHGYLEFKTLFSKFDRLRDGFLQSFYRGVFIFLWSLLLVVPGIVAALSYSMTPFIMAENPDMTPLEAIRASKELMRGHKWRYFCLGLSFIGWSILCGLTMNLGYIGLNPYTSAAMAAFYRDIGRAE